MKIPHAHVQELMQETAARYIVPRFRNLGKRDISQKSGPNDVVTIADQESEAALSAGLQKILPDAKILGEEAYAANPSIINHVHTAGWLWIIDPLDGTLAFSKGEETFGMIIALACAGEVVGGWVLDIPGQRFLRTERGAGAVLNDAVCSVSPALTVAELSGIISMKYFDDDVRPRLTTAKKNLGNVFPSLSAAHDYIDLACGRRGFALYRRMMPWDHAAGVLAHREAGGFSTNLEGKPYALQNTQAGILLAPSAALYTELAELVLPATQARAG